MRIEIVSFTGNSGLTDYAVSLSNRLREYAQTTLVTATSLPFFFNTLGFPVIRVFRRSRHYPFDILRYIFGVLRRRPDIIVHQGPLKFALVDAVFVRLLRVLGVRAAVTIHDVLPHYPMRWSAAAYGFYYRSFNKVIVHSAVARQVIISLGITAPILIVPHGVYDVFKLTGIGRAEARSRIGVNLDDFVVLFFGHLEPRKGLIEFIDVAKRLQNVPHLRFVIAGRNDMDHHGAEYQRALETARAMTNIHLRDERIPFEEVENYFAASDLVALPYREGTTSGVLKLAIAFEVPVVASRVGDLPEQVPSDGGILIDPDENMTVELEEAVLEVCKSPGRFHGGMRRAAQACDWKPIAQAYFEFLSAKD